VKPGRAYGDEIIRGIEKSRDFILVLSKESNKSAFVAREVERAVSKNKPIFTVRIDNVTPAPALELFISRTQWIDALSGKLDSHIDRLASLLAEDEGGGTSPAIDAAPSPAPHSSLWRSPLVLGGAGAAALAAAAFVFLPPRDIDTAGGSVLAETCSQGPIKN
jgi:TIR domain